MPLSKDDAPEEVSEVEFSKALQQSNLPYTDKIGDTELSQLFEVPDNGQFTYATFSEQFERYKVKVDLFKWLIGTIGLTVITYIINWGFKDREQGIAEIQIYDRYASQTVLFAENPNNRLMLAQFFANVTPSNKLKSGWKDYLRIVQLEVDSFNVKLVRNSSLLKKLAKDTSQSAKGKYLEAEQKKEELDRINSLRLIDEVLPVTGFTNTSNEHRNEALAREFERKGFQALIDKKLQTAIYNFTMSENSFNGYHNSYNIAQYLKSIEPNFVNDTPRWHVLYQTILQKFSWRMPEDVNGRLKNLIQ